MTPIMLALAAALCVVVFAWGYQLRSTGGPTAKDAAQPTKVVPPRLGPLSPLVGPLGRPFAPMLARTFGQRRFKIRRRIEKAGKANQVTIELYAADKAGNLVLFGSLGLIFILAGHVYIGSAMVLVGWFQTDAALWGMAQERQAEIQKGLPDFLDVLTVTVTAGLGFRHALERVADTMPGAVSEEMRTTLRQMGLGTPLREAFRELRARNDSETLSSFVTAILQAEELGAPLADALLSISADMRREAAQQARRRAQRVDPQITLITTFLMVPAMVLLLGGMFYFGTVGAGGMHLGNILGH